MKKRKLFALVPMLLMTSSAFASPSPKVSTSKAETTPQTIRSNFIDYSIGGENNFSYTAGIEVTGIQPMPTTSIGHLGYVADGSAPFSSASSINPNKTAVMALSGFTVISSKDAGLLLRVEGSHYNKSPNPSIVHASEDTAIFLNDIFSQSDATSAYSSISHNQTHKQTNVYVSLAGYSLQYRKTFLQTYYGLSYSCLNYQTSVSGIENTGNFNTNKQTGSQTTMGGGLFAEVEAGVVLYETADSAFMIVSRFRQGSEAISSTGSLIKSSIDGLTDEETQTHNSKLDPCSYAFFNDNRFGISYVSKPTTEDQTFFSIEAGVMSFMERGKDLLHKKAHQTAGDFHTGGVYLRLSYTM